MRAGAIALLLCLTAGVACGDKSEPAEPEAPEPGVPAEAPSPEPPAEPESAPVAAADPEPSAEEVPIPEDFEEEAESSIDEDNYTAALDALERELAERR